MRRSASALGIAPLAFLGWLSAARAQAPAPVAGAPEGQAAPASGSSLEPSGEVVVEAPIVAGNVAKAKEKALGDARKQAVERAFARLVSEAGLSAAETQTPAFVGLKASVAKGPQGFVRSYRIAEETETGGFVRVRAIVDVDEASLRRQIERARGGAAGAARPLLVVVVGGPDAVSAVQSALVTAGARADVQPLGSADPVEVQRLAAATGRSAALMVSATAEDEGLVRGTAMHAAACRLSARLLAGGEAGPEKLATTRAFDARPTGARGACLGRGAAEVIPPALAELGQVSGPSGDGRLVTLGLDIVEPAALTPTLRAVRRVGAVSASELRRVRLGRAELRAVTRLPAPELVAALRRQLGAAFTVQIGASQADRAEVQVRFAPPSEAAPSAAPPTDATTAPAPIPGMMAPRSP